jgi:hypothetical protein
MSSGLYSKHVYGAAFKECLRGCIQNISTGLYSKYVYGAAFKECLRGCIQNISTGLYSKYVYGLYSKHVYETVLNKEMNFSYHKISAISLPIIAFQMRML